MLYSSLDYVHWSAIQYGNCFVNSKWIGIEMELIHFYEHMAPFLYTLTS